jgi:DNA polymerase III alpha subunit (gram-positive type)
MKKPELFFSVDIESDGPIPADYSMLSFGAAAFLEDGKMLGTFSANLEKLPNAKECPETMEWWSKNQAAYDATRIDTKEPGQAMKEFVDWVNGFDYSPVLVAYPAGFDFLFIYWYIKHFGLESPFSFSCLDIKSFAMAVMKTDYRKATKKNMPKEWFSDEPHTHIAEQDAIEQGKLFINMLKANRNIT